MKTLIDQFRVHMGYAFWMLLAFQLTVSLSPTSGAALAQPTSPVAESLTPGVSPNKPTPLQSPWTRLLMTCAVSGLVAYVAFNVLFIRLLTNDYWPRPAFACTVSTIWIVTCCVGLPLFWTDLYGWSKQLFQETGAWQPYVLQCTAVLVCALLAVVPFTLYRKAKTA